MKSIKKYALIVAGGSGTRMGLNIPKQFAELAGKPILMHTLEAFYRFDNEIDIILVLPENQRQQWGELCQHHHFDLKHRIVSGGPQRFYSVKNGLAELEEEGVVFIHDGVRPLVSIETIQRCYQSAVLNGNAVPVIPVVESLRKNAKEGNKAVDRSKYVHVQTPQTFKLTLIKNAYLQEYDPMFTDDASVFEKTGGKIFQVEGNLENIKITTPVDLLMAELLIKKVAQ